MPTPISSSLKRFALASLLAATLPAPCPAADWIEYQCTFIASRYHDGDSFYAKAHTGHAYIWRLYGVDCPETDDREPERIHEQEAHFKVGRATLMRYGKMASEFTEKHLRGTFTARTKKLNARGQSAKNRYFALIEVDGNDLGELLVSEGLARSHGALVEIPDRRDDASDFARKLDRLERQARAARKGIWAESGRR